MRDTLRRWLDIPDTVPIETRLHDLQAKVERLQQQRDFDMQKREAQTQEIERLSKENVALKREKAQLRQQNSTLTFQVIEARANERTVRETLSFEREGLQQQIQHLLYKLTSAEARNQLNEAALRQADTQPIPDTNEVETAPADMQDVARQLRQEEKEKD